MTQKRNYPVAADQERLKFKEADYSDGEVPTWSAANEQFEPGTGGGGGGSGSVTSVDVSGGTTGLTTSGGPVTTSGVITLAGTLIVANGGTGDTSFTAHGVLVGAGTSGLAATAAMTDGQLLVGQTGADPLPKTISGAFTLAASGAATIATPGTLSASSTNSNATAHTHAITTNSAPGAAAAILATDASGIIGSTGTRIVKGWFVDLTVTNPIAGGVTGNAGTATALQNARTIGGVSFDGTANITVASATAGFTVSGGALALGANNLTITGLISSTGARVTKAWFNDIECTNPPTVSGAAVYYSGGSDVAVADGGTGASSLTAHGILVGEGTSAVTATAAMTDGQLLVGQSSADPLPKTLSGSGATFTLSAAGVLTVSAIANASLSNSSVTLNSHSLSLGGSLSLTATDIGLGSVTNDAQTKAAIVPNTAPSAGEILVGNAGGTAYAKQTLSGSGATFSLSSSGVLTISAIAAANLTGLAAVLGSDGQIPENIGGTVTGVPIDLEMCGRATLTSGAPVADATGQTAVFFTPYKGNRVTLYDGTRPIPVTFTEQSFKLTDSSQTGGSISGTTITGLTDTSKLFVGMNLSASTGTGTLAANTTIATIASATSITVNNAASVNGTLTNLVFKMPSGFPIDVYGVYSGGALVLRPGSLWTSGTTRNDTVALVNGRYTNTSVVRNGQSNSIAANAGTLLFTVTCNVANGQTDDSPGSGATAASRLLLNWYNRVARAIEMCPGYVDDNAATSYTTASTTLVAANGGTGATINCLSSGEDAISVDAFSNVTNNSTGSNVVAIGINSTSTAVAAGVVTPGSSLTNVGCNWAQVLPLGANTINLLIRVTANTGTFFADTTRGGSASDPQVTGIRGIIFA